jgi:hypothetical protein
MQTSYLTLSGCVRQSQGVPGVRLARHGIGGGGKNCDDDDAQPGALAIATGTATTAMHSTTVLHTAGVAVTCATLARSSTRTT